MHHTLLNAYDSQLRTSAEMLRHPSTGSHGPLWFALFPGGRGLVTYESLDGADEDEIAELVDAAVEHFDARSDVKVIEWKTRAHDVAPGLHEALISRGFAPEEPESIMIGEAALLAQEVRVPAGVEIRQVRDEVEIWAMEEMQGTVFADAEWRARAEATLAEWSAGSDTGLWIALVDGDVVSAGRLEPVPDTDFAGLWGGATLPQWRGRGIYRALTARRARSALLQGKKYVNADCTELSRPILERSGLIKVSTTTPYILRQPSA
ncbi:GNAT family N-acetyltransferase [Microbacterium sp.]|uniref:GNAT family N-acetyltransferase n=1 Tax=Microbacterium sp. TaxID=51671 RepID=UPI0027331CA7|nr:GNAT family N-acetyltransferase [Microbacterium sp.]MDP3951214.1 GNAT family N-acetyltransferase [Microbacterium sp.]